MVFERGFRVEKTNLITNVLLIYADNFGFHW
jgi:hypothetical protein